jgi:hypothetical protein
MPNGGFNAYAQRTTTKKFAHPNPEPRTITVTVLAGQVIKEGSWLMRNNTGKVVVHSGLAPYTAWLVSGVNPAVAGNTFILTLGTQVFTLTVSPNKTMTALEVVDAFATGVSSKGVITDATGDLTAYATYLNSSAALTHVAKASDNPAVLLVVNRTFDATSMNITPVTFVLGVGAVLAISAAATGTGSPVWNAGLGSDVDPIAGLLLYNVVAKDAAGNATDTQAQAYVSGSFWAEDWVNWYTSSTETITDAEGISHACTAYNTGCVEDLAYQAFVSNTEFHIVTQLAGEKEV